VRALYHICQLADEAHAQRSVRAHLLKARQQSRIAVYMQLYKPTHVASMPQYPHDACRR